MADDALTVKVVVDNSTVAPSFAVVRNQVDQLASGLHNAGEKGKKAGEDIAEAHERANYSIVEAKGAVSGFAEALGLKVNREVKHFLADSELIGPLLAKAFSIAAIVGMADVIVQVIAKVVELTTALGGFDEESQAVFNDAVEASTRQIVANAELLNQKAKLATIGLEGTEREAAAHRALRAEQHNDAAALTELQQKQRQLQEETEGLSAITKKWYESDIGKETVAAKQYQEHVAQLKLVNSEVESLAARTKELNTVDAERERREAAAEAKRLNRERLLATVEGDKAVGEAQIAQQETIAKGLHEVHMTSDEQWLAQQKTFIDQRYVQEWEALQRELTIAKSRGSAGAAEAEKLHKDLEALEITHNTKLIEVQNEFDNEWREKKLRALDWARSDAKAEADAQMDAIKNASERKASGISAGSPLGNDDPRVYELRKQAIKDQIDVVEVLKTAEAGRLAELEALHVAETDPDAQKNKKELLDLTRQQIKLEDELGMVTQQQTNANTQAMLRYEEQTESTFNSGIMRWINRQETFGRAMQHVWTSIAEAAITNLMKVGEMMLVNLALHRTITDGIKLDNAKQAATSALASVSAIPIIGYYIAPAAAAATFAAVMAFEQGGVVPSTSMALLHKNEMVLPAELSSHIMATAGGGGGNSYGGHTFNYNDYGGNGAGKANSREFMAMARREMRKMNR